jgi:hypothetical protein
MNRRARRGIGKSAAALLALLARQDPASGAGGMPGLAPADAESLVAADLVRRRGDGGLEITEAGRAHLARAALARAGGEIDPFRGQHLRLAAADTETPTGRARITVDLAESPLAWLARRKGRDGRALIEPAQLQSGERLRADFTRAQLMPRITANWTAAVARDGQRGGLATTLTETVVGARQQVRQALDQVGPEFTGLLLDVCCFLKGLEDVERERGWPRSSAKVVLQLGLDRLARHYGYGTEARGAPRAPVRTWLAEDARFVVGD